MNDNLLDDLVAAAGRYDVEPQMESHEGSNTPYRVWFEVWDTALWSSIRICAVFDQLDEARAHAARLNLAGVIGRLCEETDPQADLPLNEQLGNIVEGVRLALQAPQSAVDARLDPERWRGSSVLNCAVRAPESE